MRALHSINERSQDLREGVQHNDQMEENAEDTLWSATMADGRQGWFEIQMDRSPNGWDIGGSRTKSGARTSQETVSQSPLQRLF